MKVKAILYIGHGSRVEEAKLQAVSFINEMKQLISIPIQEHCFLELASPTIAEGINNCVERGATEIIVVPILLLTAHHAKKDIPNELAKASTHFPDIVIKYGQPIGVHDKIIDIMLERLHEKTTVIDGDTLILLVGRGSSDPDAPRDLRTIAKLLLEQSGAGSVDTCFLAAAEPSFEDMLQQTICSQFNKVLVLPYLLFTGILMKSMEHTIKSIASNEKEYILCNYLGYHKYLGDIIKERTEALL
ncbi:sirohydrochlorin chelatase [Cytobacillus sp. IB215665]|uniref:sirohydrochlorin chelatase n=1 Tax=Cytobacillus sp. IB215665 TaxID=3097357 RepID=UPI002A0E384D|nr:sirohydrochlorin chelatase [Cytobacillus sp. IB215665]MDX8365812.1 sirohydrochlorin chelatase [Cytobacillus sp. IB215665]